MGLFTGRPKPTTPGRPTDAAIAAGMATFVADLTSGDAHARDMARGRAPMPTDATGWARYPKDPTRQKRLKHFGAPSPLPLPQQLPTTTA